VRLRVLAAAVPRQTAAAVLVAVAQLTLPAGVLAVGGAGAAIVTFGALSLVYGAFLSWE
jgi:hypothetical protein